MEANVAQASAILDAFLDRRWDDVRKDFDETMSARLTPEMLDQSTGQLDAQLGKLLSRGDPTTRTIGEHSVVDIPLHFERAEMTFRIAVDADGKVAGLFIAQPSAL